MPVFILAVFGILLLQPGAILAETFDECRTSCYADMKSDTANCPPSGEEAHTQCLQESRQTLKSCLDNCLQASRADTPADAPADTPKDTPAETPTDTPTDSPKDIPMDIPHDTSDTPKEN